MMWEKYWYDNQVFDILGRRKKWDDDFLSVKAFFLLTLYNIQCFQLLILLNQWWSFSKFSTWTIFETRTMYSQFIEYSIFTFSLTKYSWQHWQHSSWWSEYRMRFDTAVVRIREDVAQLDTDIFPPSDTKEKESPRIRKCTF